MSSTVQKVALAFGVVFVVIGVLGFVLGSSTMDTRLMIGLFHVNLVHNVVHLVFGVWGLVASRSGKWAETYAEVGGVVYLVLALVGFFAPNGFGLIPIGSHNIWLHGLIGLILAYVGFGAVEVDDSDIM